MAAAAPSDAGNVWYPSCNPLWRTMDNNRVAYLSTNNTFASIRTEHAYEKGRVTVEFRSPDRNFDRCMICIIPATWTKYDTAVDGSNGSGVRYDWDGDLYVTNNGNHRSAGHFGAGQVTVVKLVLDFNTRKFEFLLDDRSQGEFSMNDAGLMGPVYPAFCTMFDVKLHITAPLPIGVTRSAPTEAQLVALRKQVADAQSSMESQIATLVAEYDRNQTMIDELQKKASMASKEIADARAAATAAEQSLTDAKQQQVQASKVADDLHQQVTQLKATIANNNKAATPPPETKTPAAGGSGASTALPAIIDIFQFKGGKSDLKELDRSSFTDRKWADADKIFRSCLNGKIEDYNGDRIAAGLPPIGWVVSRIDQVVNPVLEYRYQYMLASLRYEESIAQMAYEKAGSTGKPPEILSKEHHGFHGCKPPVIRPICTNGLLRVGHPLNPSQSTDEGFFGIPTMGVYLSRYADYTFKYTNAELKPLDVGESCQVVMFKILPGRTRHIEAVTPNLKPTDSPGYHSHSSPNFSEWYLFNEAQCCPTHVFTIRAIADTRTKSDDGL